MLGDVERFCPALTLLKAVVWSLVQTYPAAWTIVQSVVSNRWFIIPLSITVSYILDKEVDDLRFHSTEEVSTALGRIGLFIKLVSLGLTGSSKELSDQKSPQKLCNICCYRSRWSLLIRYNKSVSNECYLCDTKSDKYSKCKIICSRQWIDVHCHRGQHSSKERLPSSKGPTYTGLRLWNTSTCAFKICSITITKTWAGKSSKSQRNSTEIWNRKCSAFQSNQHFSFLPVD